MEQIPQLEPIEYNPEFCIPDYDDIMERSTCSALQSHKITDYTCKTILYRNDLIYALFCDNIIIIHHADEKEFNDYNVKCIDCSNYGDSYCFITMFFSGEYLCVLVTRELVAYDIKQDNPKEVYSVDYSPYDYNNHIIIKDKLISRKK